MLGWKPEITGNLFFRLYLDSLYCYDFHKPPYCALFCSLNIIYHMKYYKATHLRTDTTLLYGVCRSPKMEGSCSKNLRLVCLLWYFNLWQALQSPFKDCFKFKFFTCLSPLSPVMNTMGLFFLWGTIPFQEPHGSDLTLEPSLINNQS